MTGTVTIMNCVDEMGYRVLVDNLDEGSRICPVIGTAAATWFSQVLRKVGISYDLQLFNSDHAPNTPIASAIHRHNGAVTGRAGHIVVALSGQEWPGLHYAKVVRAPLYIASENSKTVKGIIESSGAHVVSVILGTAQLDWESFNVIERLQSDNRLDVGFIASHDLISLVNLINKINVYRRQPSSRVTHIVRTEHATEKLDQDNVQVIPYEMSTPKTISEGIDTDLLTLVGHGRDDIFWLTNGAICGRVNTARTFRFGSFGRADFPAVPACSYNGVCFKPDLELIPAWSINARHVFAYSCYSARVDNGLYERPYNLAFGFLDGIAASVLGTSTIVSEPEYLHFYYTALLLQGVALGEAARVIRTTYSRTRRGHEWSFFLLGDPSWKLTKRTVPVINDSLTRYVKKWILPPGTWLVRFAISNSLARDLNEGRLRLVLGSKPHRQLYAVPQQSDHESYLDVFGQDSLSPELYIRLVNGSMPRISAAENLDEIALVKFGISRKNQNTIRELKSLAWELVKNNVRDRIDWSAHVHKSSRKYTEMLSAFSMEMVETIIARTHANGFSWDDQCMVNGYEFVGTTGASDPCPGCSRPTNVLRYRHGVSPRFERHFVTCP